MRREPPDAWIAYFFTRTDGQKVMQVMTPPTLSIEME